MIFLPPALSFTLHLDNYPVFFFPKQSYPVTLFFLSFFLSNPHLFFFPQPGVDVLKEQKLTRRRRIKIKIKIKRKKGGREGGFDRNWMLVYGFGPDHVVLFFLPQPCSNY